MQPQSNGLTLPTQQASRQRILPNASNILRILARSVTLLPHLEILHVLTRYMHN